MSSSLGKPKTLVILGPTASGKSGLAVELARRFNGEIISADSRQVYRGMDIGTGKVTKKEMRDIPHHLLDVASPRARFTVEQYRKLARTEIKKILTRGKLPIVVGGTGLYIDALIYNYQLPAVKPNAALRRKLETESAVALFKKLQKLDPHRAATIDPHNKRRLVRALEIVMTTKQPVPDRTEALARGSDYDVLKIGLQLPTKTLEKNIHVRLATRMRQGMVKEVARLHAQGISWKRLDELGLEYRWVSRYLQGEMTKNEMMQKLETEIRHYAKRQMTWFKREKDIEWITNPRDAARSVKKFLKQI